MPPVYSASAHLFPPVGVLQFLSMGSYDAGITPHCVSDTTDVLLPSHHHLRDAHQMPMRKHKITAVLHMLGYLHQGCVGYAQHIEMQKWIRQKGLHNVYHFMWETFQDAWKR